MAGSRLDFQYISDKNSTYALAADESNTKLVNSAGDLSTLKKGTPRLPTNLKPRHIILANQARTVRRKCYVLTASRLATFSDGDTYTVNINGTDTTMYIVGIQGEQRSRIAIPFDTGINDGTDDTGRFTSPTLPEAP